MRGRDPNAEEGRPSGPPLRGNGPWWTIRGAIVAVLPILLCGCGPTEEEAGTWVLCASPMALLAGLLLLAALYRLWRRRYPEVAFRRLPSFLMLVPLVNGAAGKVLFQWKLADGTFLALAAFGTSYLAILFLIWRIWFAFDERRAFTWATLPAMALCVAPAIWFAYEGSTTQEAPDWVLAYWTWPGFMGWVPGGMFLLLLVEAAIRGRAPNPLAGETTPG